MPQDAADMTRIAAKNPRTGEVDYQFEVTSRSEIEEHCKRLSSEQIQWGKAPLSERISVMLKWADAVERHRESIIKAEAIDTGRWRISSEAPDTVIWGIRGWCERAESIINNAIDVGDSTTMPETKLAQQLIPFPLLGVISPWNFPLMLSSIDAIPALIAGSAVIIKPSEVTPRFVEPIQESIADVPELAKVLRYVQGAGETGQAIIDNVDIICFTGSVQTGRKVAEAAARNFIPAFLELGGKDPVIVTKSADIERATDAVLRGSVHATGQICFSIERVYVDLEIHDVFVDRLVEKSEEIVLNSEDIRSGHVGPLIFERQAHTIDHQLDDAIAQGAIIRTGGKSETIGGGKYVRPTVVTGVNHQMKLMRDETFGPIMPVMSYATLDEAISLANDTEFGLSAAVIAGDEKEAMAIGQRINAGGVSLMDTTLTGAILRDAEKTSFNLSGLGGSRMGPASIMRFFRKKALITNPSQPMRMQDLLESK
ncbi:MAG: aldehyde dehydrogenase family protein [Rhodospirillaceae bacterium]